MTRIPRELLTGARERARPDTLALTGRFPKLISGGLRIANAERFLENTI